MDFEEKLNHLSDYLKHRTDIIVQNPNRWLNYVGADGRVNTSYYNLPSFEYYLKNCVQDKGGAYDFTKRRYKTPSQILKPIETANFTNIISKNSKYKRRLLYSNWMGTPFNFNEVSENVL